MHKEDAWTRIGRQAARSGFDLERALVPEATLGSTAVNVLIRRGFASEMAVIERELRPSKES